MRANSAGFFAGSLCRSQATPAVPLNVHCVGLSLTGVTPSIAGLRGAWSGRRSPAVTRQVPARFLTAKGLLGVFGLGSGAGVKARDARASSGRARRMAVAPRCPDRFELTTLYRKRLTPGPRE